MTVTDETVIEVGDANDESEKSLFTGYEIEITNITITVRSPVGNTSSVHL